MDFKKTKAPITTVTNNLSDMESKVGNIYEAVVICAKGRTRYRRKLNRN